MPLNKKIESETGKITFDNTSGSTEIVLIINETAKRFINDTRSLQHLCEKLNKEFGTFAVVKDYVFSLQSFIVNKDYHGMKNFINTFSNKYEEKYQNIYKNSTKFFREVKTIITLSNSRTLIEVFTLWKKDKKGIHIIVCESRPIEEGKIFAQQLLEQNIKTTLITDSSINIKMSKCDAVIIGADMILSNGNVVNKTGSALLALSANKFKKPVYVMADKSKFTKRKSFTPSKYPSSEIWDMEHPMLSVDNYYFEEVEKKFITKIITD